MHGESGYERYKEPDGVEMTARKAIGIQLYGAARTAGIPSLMRAVTLRGQNTTILWRLTFICFLICSCFTLFACGVACHTGGIVYIHGRLCIMYEHAPVYIEQNTIFCGQCKLNCVCVG